LFWLAVTTYYTMQRGRLAHADPCAGVPKLALLTPVLSYCLRGSSFSPLKARQVPQMQYDHLGEITRSNVAVQDNFH
jgi:hypothetical protein